VIQSADQTSQLHIPQRYEQVARRLAADIAAGRLSPGQRLPSERELARSLGVGRASVREALAALANQGLLETRPGSGSFVAGDAAARLPEELPHDASPSDLLEARALLEPAIARLAADRARAGARAAGANGGVGAGPDAELESLLAAMDAPVDLDEPADRARWSEADRLFHRRIAALTGNPVLLALAEEIAAHMDEPLWQRLRDESVATPGRTRLHAAEHRMIHDAIVDGDRDAAEFYATQHIARVRRYMTLDLEP
jgi:DNA-binding FadR family transcriptional regulator